MTHPTPLLGGIEQILLLLFMLMVLVGLAGGNPSSVITPVFDIAKQLITALLSLLSSLLISLIQLVTTVLTSGVKLLSETLRDASKTQRNR